MSRELRIGLREYQRTLERQLVNLNDQKSRLDQAWSRTRMVYEGDGADAFEAAYHRAMTMLAQYSDAISTIMPILNERLEALEHFDSPQSPNL